MRARRILWWPSGSLRDRPEVFGEALPAEGADPQRPPRHPTFPRVSMKKVRRSAAMQHRLLGVSQRDGMPLILPVGIVDATPDALLLACESDLLPAGERRAGFLAHRFRPGLIGLSTATHTGWLRVDGIAAWTPHSRHAFTAPPRKTLLLLANGAAARWGYRRALDQGRHAVVRDRRAVTCLAR